MKIDEVFGKQVLTLREGRRIGKVSGATVSKNERRVTHLRVEPAERGSERYLPWSAVHAIGPDAVTTTSVDNLLTAPPVDDTADTLDFIGNRQVVTENGRKLGAIRSYSINSQTGEVESYSLTEIEVLGFPLSADRKIHASDVLTFGEDVVVVSDAVLETTDPDQDELEARADEGAATIPPA